MTMTLTELHENLKEVGHMQREVKRRCMLFQVDMKERAATKYGLPVWAFYHMSYEELSLLRDQEKAVAWWRKNMARAAKAEAWDYASSCYGYTLDGRRSSSQITLAKMCLRELKRIMWKWRRANGHASEVRPDTAAAGCDAAIPV